MIIDTVIFICDKCQKTVADVQMLNCTVTSEINTPITEDGWTWAEVNYHDILLCPDCSKKDTTIHY
jgi:hypothetical protein